MCLKFFKMQLHSFDLGNVFVTCAWTVFLLCKAFCLSVVLARQNVEESLYGCAKAVVTSAMLAQASFPS